jgi:chromosome partitioning protein
MATILAVANQKGGVGKTTSAINLGAALAERGRRVLLVDSDPQANLTGSLGLPKESPSTYELLLGDVPAIELIRSAASAALPDAALHGANGTVIDEPVLDVIPASPALAGAEVELVLEQDRHRRLQSALASVAPIYDYVFIDCPPSLGILTLNALAGADGVVAPVQCEYLALEGLSQLLDTLRRVRDSLNPRLRRLFLLMTMYDARTGLAQSVVEEVRRHFPDIILPTIVPRTVRLGEAPSYGQSILRYDPSGRGAAAYRALAIELDDRCAAATAGLGAANADSSTVTTNAAP